MEGPPSPKPATAIRRDDNQESTHSGIRVDGGRYHTTVYGGKYQRGSVGTCMFFHPRSLSLGFTLSQLGDVARGLVYMHDQEIIHGNLNGVRFSVLLSPFCAQLTWS